VRRALGLVLVAALLPGPGAEAQEWPLRGFLQAGSGYRLIQPDRCPGTQRLACREDFVLGQGRARLEFLPRGERWGLVARGELVGDVVGGEVEGQLREGYLDLRLPAADLRVGRQIITWGVGDLVFINDIFPKDWAAFISGLPLEYLKKGADALSLTVHRAPASLQLVVIPRFEPDTLPEAGGRLRFHDPMAAVSARHTDDPAPGRDGPEVGLRLSGNAAGWDLSLYLSRGFFRVPAAEVEPGPRLRSFFPPLNVYGASAQGAALGGVVSLEAGYHDSRRDRSGRDPSVENSRFKYLVGYQREVLPDLGLGLQYAGDVMEDHAAYLATRGPGMSRRPAVRHLLTGRLTWLLLHQTWRLALFVMGSPNEGDVYVNPEATYHVTDALWVALGVNLFGGPRRTDLGQWEGNSSLYAVARYAF
jgi:hypothetical protein